MNACWEAPAFSSRSSPKNRACELPPQTAQVYVKSYLFKVSSSLWRNRLRDSNATNVHLPAAIWMKQHGSRLFHGAA
jgi:hypothetical protein